METLRLVTVHQGRKVPTVGGFLLFGKDRERYFPDAWIQVGRFRGTDKTDIIDHTEIKTHLVQAVEDAISFVRKHTLHGAEIGAVRRTERWSLPPMPTTSSAEHPSAWRSSTTGWRQLAASSPDTPANGQRRRTAERRAPSAGLLRVRVYAGIDLHCHASDAVAKRRCTSGLLFNRSG